MLSRISVLQTAELDCILPHSTGGLPLCNAGLGSVSCPLDHPNLTLHSMGCLHLPTFRKLMLQTAEDMLG